MAAAVGTLGQMGIGTANPTTYMLDFMSESLRRVDESVDGNGVRGTRSRHATRVRAGLQRIAGPVRWQPNAADLHQLLPWILCGTTTVVSGTKKWYHLGETAATRYVQIDRHAKVFTYSTVGVDTCKFSADQGALLNAEAGLVACTETVGNAGTFPALAVDITTNPFILSDLVMTVGGTTVTAKRFEVELNNNIDKDRFFNSNTMTAVVALDRVVTFRTQLPYGDFTALYNTGAGTGVAVLATFTNGSVSLIFNMGSVIFPPMSPLVPGREEVMLDLEGKAYRTGALSDSDAGHELITHLDTGV